MAPGDRIFEIREHNCGLRRVVLDRDSCCAAICLQPISSAYPVVSSGVGFLQACSVGWPAVHSREAQWGIRMSVSTIAGRCAGLGAYPWLLSELTPRPSSRIIGWLWLGHVVLVL